tara:strand:+ start:389 stop:1456 length:1068 start_codon:yes stop_codon:yes gene_type:complete
MSIVNRTRNIFIDSEQYHSNGDLVKLYFPNEAFSTFKDESMRIVLSSFEMKKNFYNINKYNNTFYAYKNDGNDISYIPITIKEGDYDFFGYSSRTTKDSFTNALSEALEDSDISATDISYSPNTRKLTIHLSNTSDISGFATFQIPENRQPNMGNKVSPLGMFQDSYEILGAKPTKYLDNSNTEPIQAFEISGNSYTSFYPASLYTIDSVHLVTSLQNNNYQTPTLDVNSSQSRLIPTQIFARIPITFNHGGKYGMLESEGNSEKITFEDTGAEIFSINLQQNQINTMNFSICDPKGRKLEEVDVNQYDNGALSYKMVLKWEAIHNPEIGQPSGYLSNSHQFQPYQETRFIKGAF